ncbi:MAG: rhodanese-like domain-containing protein [bacterium]|nr:rhodanese-like domain-containing protein [bacterium]
MSTSVISSIQPQELARIAKEQGSVELIDVRTPGEFQAVHVPFARNVPLDGLDPQQILSARNGHSDQPLYIICQSSVRGAKACQQFHQAGFDNVINVDGGTKAWADLGLPVTRGKKSISLERQVRITAGFLILLGAILAWFVHPAFVVLSGFCGAGLLHSGITDSCAMAMMLAKMPWNKA